MLEWKWLSFDDLHCEELYRVLRLRAEIFVVEQNCVYQDLDGLDQQAWHLLGHMGRDLSAYCRLVAPGLRFPEPSIGRVVLSPKARGKGLGHLMMRMAIERSQELYPGRDISLSAQAHLQNFYAAHGFRVEGDGYIEDGIPHLHMVWRALSDGSDRQ